MASRSGRGDRNGISLIEVLMSMFVLLIGLMGAAALFPVGNFYAQKGEKFDLGGTLGQAAMEELVTRGMLQPDIWQYAQTNQTDPGISLIADNGAFNLALPDQGHAFVIDPLGNASGITIGSANLGVFPLNNSNSYGMNNNVDAMPEQWSNPPAPQIGLNNAGTQWPVRRMSMPSYPTRTISPQPLPMTGPVAETIFTLRDDLVVEQPKENDHPAIQRWEVTDPNNTPNNPTDDVPLTRQFQGNYSWLATIVPTSTAALSGLQPADPGYGAYDYEVSVVVFRKRDITPSAESERLVDARLWPGGEIEMYLQDKTNPDPLDTAFQDIRSGDWIAVMGVHQTTGVFLLKWYRMLALDHEASENPNVSNEYIRRAMLAGPDWPFGGQNQANNLKVALLPGAIGVVTRPMKMETDSLWRIE